MTVESLMTQPATLKTLTGETRGPAGGSEPTYSDTAFTGYFEPDPPIGLEGENTQEGNFEMGRWFGCAPVSLTFTGHDVIEYNGEILELTGPPRKMWNPRLGAFSHYELSLRVVEVDQ